MEKKTATAKVIEMRPIERELSNEEIAAICISNGLGRRFTAKHLFAIKKIVRESMGYITYEELSKGIADTSEPNVMVMWYKILIIAEKQIEREAKILAEIMQEEDF